MALVCRQCYWCAEHVASVNIWANCGLVVVKLIGGIFGRSHALMADALHSLSDVIIALFLWVTLKISGGPPDEDHHWGHGNVEFIVSVIVGVLLLCGAVTITAVSLTSIIEGITPEPGIVAVWAAAISVIANEIMFRHSICVGEQMGSPAIMANAWENRADVYSSVAALIGVFGARMGFAFLDPAAAILVGLMIARSGLRTLVAGIGGITDRSIDRATLARVKRIVLKERGIRDVGRLRARKIGQ